MDPIKFVRYMSNDKYFNDYKYIKIDGKEITVDDWARLYITACSTFACFLIYNMSPLIFYTTSQTYGKLKLKDRMFWNLAFVRGVYGSIGVVFSVYERFFDPVMINGNIVTSKSLISSILILNHMGFFLFEWPAQIYFDLRFEAFNKALHAHHIIALTGYVTTSLAANGHYYACSAFILEMSTPFSCVCYCLVKSKLADTLMWRINQMMLVHTFHLRSVIECCMMYEIVWYWEDFKKLPVIWLVNAIVGLLAIGFFLTPYWTYRKTEQLFSKSDWNDESDNNDTTNKKKE